MRVRVRESKRQTERERKGGSGEGERGRWRRREEGREGMGGREGHLYIKIIPYFITQVKVVVFDKTGTLTYGRPEVVRVLLLVSEAICPTRLFTAIMGLAESRSEHPLGVAILEFARNVSYKLCTFLDSKN